MRTKNILFFILIISSLLIISACKKVKYDDIGTPFSKAESILGKWKVTNVLQVDEDAKSKGATYQELDITNLFNEYTITFNIDTISTDSLVIDSTYSISTGGSPNFVDTLGKWSFDDNEFPWYIYFKRQGASTTTSTLKLAAPPANGYPLRVLFERYSGGKAIVTYHFEFEKEELLTIQK